MNYCEACNKEIIGLIKDKEEDYEVLGDHFIITTKIMICPFCGEEIYDETLDEATLQTAFNAYRDKHKLLHSDEIKRIREQYGLSQRGFSRLLNWGDKTIHRYEMGSIQDKAHNSLLLFLRDPKNMKTYLLDNELTINSKTKEKILAKIEKLNSGTHNDEPPFSLNLFFSDQPTIENGYKGFDFGKAASMVIFFCHESKSLLKTKLMKLMHYADMIFYKENGISISGMKYVHLPYGPVPDNFDIFLGLLNANEIAHEQLSFKNGYEFHRIVTNKTLMNHAFSEEEISVLKRVSDYFKKFTSSEISEYSHKETGYQKTKPQEIISYAYSANIDLP